MNETFIEFVTLNSSLYEENKNVINIINKMDEFIEFSKRSSNLSDMLKLKIKFFFLSYKKNIIMINPLLYIGTLIIIIFFIWVFFGGDKGIKNKFIGLNRIDPSKEEFYDLKDASG